MSGHHENLKTLLQKSNADFLRGYAHVMDGVMNFMVIEDSSLLRPVAPGDIPCFFRTNMDQELSNHGAVGGGPVPQNLVCHKVPHQQSTLPQLSWALPSYATEVNVNQYEIEYEHVPDGRPPSPNNTGPIDMHQSKPMVVPKSGKAQAHVMNDLYPGYRYRFRVRSRSIAGWGMWSKSITGRFEGFPVRIPFTGEKVSIMIPESGEYRITSAGAKAADGGKEFKGGQGAVISAVFSLQLNDRIEVAVGGMSQMGPEGHSGGGGGTFVLIREGSSAKVENLLVVAGGGGGTRGYDDQDEDGCDASLEPSGKDGRGKEHGKGGRDGFPGMDANLASYQGPCWGHGGAGFSKSSKTAKCYNEGLEGGQCGGYGGGGGVGFLGGGGGGGFSGGGGGRGGGGGGSYVSEKARNVTKKVENDGNGYVSIERLSQDLDPLISMTLIKDNASGSTIPIETSPTSTGLN